MSVSTSYQQTANPFPFRMVKEGRGGTFTFRDPAVQDKVSNYDDEVDPDRDYQDRSSIRRIGTYACRTCVALYYQIDDKRCFMAHIDGVLKESGSTAITPDDRVVTDDEGKELQSRVLDALKQQVERSGWAPEAGHKAVACCPQLELSNGRTLVGKYVLAAIRDFRGDDVKLEMLEEKDGFIVHQAKGQVEFTFDWNEDANPALPPRAIGLGWYVACDDPGDRWTFEVER